MLTATKRRREGRDDAPPEKRACDLAGNACAQRSITDGLGLLLPGSNTAAWRRLATQGYLVVDVRTSVLVAALRDIGVAYGLSCRDREDISNAASRAFRATVRQLACFRRQDSAPLSKLYPPDDSIYQPSFLASGVIGTPCSLHNPLARRLRWHMHTMVVRPLLCADAHGFSHAQTMAGPMIYRDHDELRRSVDDAGVPVGVRRDPGHAVFGYWVNMDPVDDGDAQPQILSCVSAAGSRVDVHVPPGHAVIYNEAIVHAANDPPSRGLQRITAGFCFSSSAAPLLGPATEIAAALEQQGMLPLADGRLVPMYVNTRSNHLYWRVADWAAYRLKSVCMDHEIVVPAPADDAVLALLRFKKELDTLPPDDERRSTLPSPKLPDLPPRVDAEYVEQWHAWCDARAAARTPAEIPSPPERGRHARCIVPQTMPPLAHLEARSSHAPKDERVLRYDAYTSEEIAIYQMTDTRTSVAPIAAETWFDLERLKSRLRYPGAQSLATLARRMREIDRQCA